jgi:hypothetical protein
LGDSVGGAPAALIVACSDNQEARCTNGGFAMPRLLLPLGTFLEQAAANGFHDPDTDREVAATISPVPTGNPRRVVADDRR